MHPGLNSNFLIIIPKCPRATIIDQYRPYSLENFMFKLITKTIVKWLGGIYFNIQSQN